MKNGANSLISKISRQRIRLRAVGARTRSGWPDSHGQPFTFEGWPAWQIERAKLIHRACLSIQRRLKRGWSVRKAARVVSWWARRRGLKGSNKHALQLSRSTLIRLYYAWVRNPAPEVFRLNYKPGGKRINEAHAVKALALQIALNPNILTAKSAHEALKRFACEHKSVAVPCFKTFARYLTGVPLKQRRKLAAKQHRLNAELAQVNAAIREKIATLQHGGRA